MKLRYLIGSIGVCLTLVGLIFMMPLILLGGFALMVLPTFVEKGPHFANLESNYGWNERSDEPYDRPTKLSQLVEHYMKADPMDPSTTLDFLMETDKLEDPFADAQHEHHLWQNGYCPTCSKYVLNQRGEPAQGPPGNPVGPKGPPPPKTPGTENIGRAYNRKDWSNPAYSIMDDLARAYAVTPHLLDERNPSELDHIRHLVASGVMSHYEAEQYLKQNMTPRTLPAKTVREGRPRDAKGRFCKKLATLGLSEQEQKWFMTDDQRLEAKYSGQYQERSSYVIPGMGHIVVRPTEKGWKVTHTKGWMEFLTKAEAFAYAGSVTC